MQQALDAEVLEHHARIAAEQDSINAQAQEKLKQLKSDIFRAREARMKLHSKITVVSTRPESSSLTRPSSGAVEANTSATTTTESIVTAGISSGAQMDSTTTEPSTSARLTNVTSSSALAPPAGVNGTPKDLGVNVTPAATPDGGVNSATAPLDGVTPVSIDTTATAASSEVVAEGDGTTPFPDSV